MFDILRPSPKIKRPRLAPIENSHKKVGHETRLLAEDAENDAEARAEDDEA